MYRAQGIEIADKHIEIIVRQMMRKVKVEEANDTYHAARLAGGHLPL